MMHQAEKNAYRQNGGKLTHMTHQLLKRVAVEHQFLAHGSEQEQQ